MLRIEAMAHNARDLGCRLGASYFPEAVEALRQMVDRFVEVLDCLDTAFVDAGLLARLLDDERYSPSRAAYDLRKFRCKGLATKIPRSRRYRADAEALRAMAALLLLRDKVVHPLLAAASASRRAPRPRTSSAVDQRYAAVHHEMRSLFDTLGIAA